MKAFFIRLLICAGGIAAAAWIVPGVAITGPGTLLLAALLMGLINAFVRPVAVLLTLPATIVTLGVFLLVVNAALFGLVAWLLEGFVVTGFWPALFGWLIVWFVSWLASAFVGPRGSYGIYVAERRN
ncbi:MAG TPA: phage holin family protein [Gammaproteobacteria bacterium]|nr:phage holin family protein [Gammaproteobacteria bacterium]